MRPSSHVYSSLRRNFRSVRNCRNSRHADNVLIDGSEDAAAIAVKHFDADTVAHLHPGCDGGPLFDDLEGPPFGEAAPPNRSVAVRYGTGTKDSARPETSCFRQMRNQILEAKYGFAARIRMSEFHTVILCAQRQMQVVAAPIFAKFIRRHRDRRERAWRLRLVEAKLLAELAGDKIAQGNVVANHEKLDVIGRR